MSYELHAVSAITDIPALVGTFAQTIGFSVDLSTPSQPIIWNPTPNSNSISNTLFYESDPIRWRLQASAAGLTHRLFLEMYDYTSNSLLDTIITSGCDFFSPITDPAQTAAAVLVPSFVHLFGDLSPAPYIGIVVEYPGDIYRHMYIGNMEKIGDYEGGEVISASDGPGTITGTTAYNSTTRMKYLFSARSSFKSAAFSGGVYADAGSNDVPWRKFLGPISTAPLSNMGNEAVIGGFNDSINDGYLARARAPFAGSNILVPINLYATEQLIGDSSFIPIGRPAGIRAVNMQDLSPKQEIIVGGFEWFVFPALSRQLSKNMTKSSASSYPVSLSSHWVGYAYRTGEEDSNS